MPSSAQPGSRNTRMMRGPVGRSQWWQTPSRVAQPGGPLVGGGVAAVAGWTTFDAQAS